MKRLGLGLAAGLCAVALMGAASRNGEVAPPFTATDLQGNRVSLADLRGKVVVLHFAASW